MSSSMILGLFDWVGDFFKSLLDLIPKMIYLLYASLACILDVLQLFFRKLAGLDVYYIDGQQVSGDIVTNFISGILGITFDGNDTVDYSGLSTVFYAFVLFGVVICFVSTFVAIIKSHYNYDDKAAKGPMQYVYTALKSILNMVVVPLVVVLGLYVSQALLTALDDITTTGSSDIVSLYGSGVDELASVQNSNGEQIYIFYDIFGYQSGIIYSTSGTLPSDDDYTGSLGLIGAQQESFSGSLFKVAAYNANRVRTGARSTNSNFTGNNDTTDTDGTSSGLFSEAETNDELAEMIDTAFANNLHYSNAKYLDYGDGSCYVSTQYFTNFYSSSIAAYSKFNISAVWYYYDLWEFNYIVGFGGVIVCLTIFINIILGLMQRLIYCVGLFLVMPAAYGVTPLDGGKMSQNWRETFMKQVLMTYGAVIGMNIVFLIMPYINNISFFNIAIADYFANVLFLIVALVSIKGFIGMISSIVGGADANETGGKIAGEVGKVAGTALKVTGKAATMGFSMAKGAATPAINAYKKHKEKRDKEDEEDDLARYRNGLASGAAGGGGAAGGDAADGGAAGAAGAGGAAGGGGGGASPIADRNVGADPDPSQSRAAQRVAAHPKWNKAKKIGGGIVKGIGVVGESVGGALKPALGIMKDVFGGNDFIKGFDEGANISGAAKKRKEDAATKKQEADQKERDRIQRQQLAAQEAINMNQGTQISNQNTQISQGAQALGELNQINQNTFNARNRAHYGAQQTFNSASTGLSSARSSSSSANAEYKAVNKDYRASNARLKKAEALLVSDPYNQELKKMTEELRTEAKRLKEKNAEALKKRKEMQAELDKAQAEFNKAEEEVKKFRDHDMGK